MLVEVTAELNCLCCLLQCSGKMNLTCSLTSFLYS